MNYSIQNLFKIGLFLCLFTSGFSGIVAELNLFNLAHLLVGGTNRVLTYTMGVMMFFMGMGSLCIRFRFLNLNRLTLFFLIEILLSALIVSSVFVIYSISAVFPQFSFFLILAYSASIGFLIGFEIPLMLLILENHKNNLIRNTSFILFADYFGSLIGFVLFSHVLLHKVGIPLSTIIVANLNLGLAILVILLFKPKLLQLKRILFIVSLTLILIITLFFQYPKIINWSEKKLFRDEILISTQTPYQQVILTQGYRNQQKNYDKIKREKSKLIQRKQIHNQKVELRKFKSISRQPDLRLFINGALQFSTLDEFHYHETLVHPAMHLHANPKIVLIGGGGDGLALREVLKHPEVEQVFVVDIDSLITDYFSTHENLKQINNSSLTHPKVTLVHQDAFTFLQKTNYKFDVAILDFPDPHTETVAKLYSIQFYQRLKTRLTPKAIVVTQSTSPLYHRQVFLTIRKTLAVALEQQPLSLQVIMPTFGQWGFQLIALEQPGQQVQQKLNFLKLKVKTQYLNTDVLKSMSLFGKTVFKDSAFVNVENWLKPQLVKAYNQP